MLMTIKRKSQTLQSKVYITADGMKTDECFGDWQPAGWKTQDDVYGLQRRRELSK